MGYTHYWYYNPSKTNKNINSSFEKALSEIKKYKNLLESRGLVLTGPMGEGIPILNGQKIAFNGDSECGLNHESFVVELDHQAVNHGFDFCKTARKPYDTLVCLSLISLFEAFGDSAVFSYCSDGSDADWVEAREIYREVNGKEAPTLEAAQPPSPTP
jgi:hypothetical protein